MRVSICVLLTDFSGKAFSLCLLRRNQARDVLPYDPAFPSLCMYLDKAFLEKDACTYLFTAALFTTPKSWKQPKCPSTDEWIKLMWYEYKLNTTQPKKKKKI